jgi:hypothetical protein
MCFPATCARWGLINVLNQDDARAVCFEILINASDVSLQRFEN